MNRKTLLHTQAGGLRAPWRLLVFVVGALLLAAIFSFVIIVPFTGLRAVPTGPWTLAASSVMDVAGALAATWIALRWIDRKPWRDVGLDESSARPEVVCSGFLIGGAAIALPILILILVGWLRSEPVLGMSGGHPIIRLTALLVPAALTEELLMRGYVLTVLREAWGSAWAVVATSIVFGLLHLGNAGVDLQAVVLVTLAGVFLGVVRITTGSLYAAWAAHFGWNWVMAALFHAPVSGLAFDAPRYRYVDAGPSWATGGAWGPEGGVPAGLAMIAGTGLLLLWRRRRGNEQIGGQIDV